MPAEILREPGPPPLPESQARPAEPDLTGYAKIYQQQLDAIRPKYEAAEKLAREGLEQRRQEFGALSERMRATPAAPARPAFGPPPPAPTIQARPFLDGGPGDSWQTSLQKLMAGMGLMAQMAVGIKGGFPSGALAAYTGAVQGWTEGDHLRAANQWKTYLGQLQEYDRSVNSVQQDFENAMKEYGADQDRLKTEFGILAAKHNLDREGIELAFREPDRLMQQLTQGVKLLEQMQTHADNVAFRNLMGMHKIQNDRENLELKRENNARLAQQAEDTRRMFDMFLGPNAGGGGGQPGQPPMRWSPSVSMGQGGPRVTLQPNKIGETEQKALVTYDTILATIRDIKTNFSDQEIEAYTGLLQRPYQDAKMMLSSIPGLGGMADQRYAMYRTMLGRMTGTAFGEGGKQLTPFEAAVVFSYTPTGSERGGSTEVKAKLDNLERYTLLRRALTARYTTAGIDPTTVPNQVWDAELTVGMQNAGVAVPKGKAPSGKTINVMGPNGERGTVPVGTDLSQYPGWKATP